MLRVKPLPTPSSPLPHWTLAIVPQPLTVEPHTPVVTALRLMQRARSAPLEGWEKPGTGGSDFWAEYYRSARSSSVVVVAEGQVLGILTEREVLDFCAQVWEESRSIEDTAPAGSDRVNTDRAGLDRANADRANTDRAGIAQTNSDRANADRAGIAQTNSDRVNADRAGLDRVNADRSRFDPNTTVAQLMDPDRRILLLDPQLFQAADWPQRLQSHFQNDSRPLVVVNDRQQLQGLITRDSLALTLLPRPGEHSSGAGQQGQAIAPAHPERWQVEPWAQMFLPQESGPAATSDPVSLPTLLLPDDSAPPSAPATLISDHFPAESLADTFPQASDQGDFLRVYHAQMQQTLDLAQQNQQQTAATFWENEQRLQQAIQHAPFPLMIHAEDGEVLAISDIWTELTGYTHLDLPTTQAWAERAYGGRSTPVYSPPPGPVDPILATWENGELTIKTRNRGQRIWRFSAAPFGFLEDGRRLVVAMATDLTQERQQTQLMQAREARYRALMEGASDAIIVTNCEGFIIDANQKAEELFGYSLVHLIQLHLFQLCLPQDWQGIQRGFEAIMAGTRQDFFDTRIVRQDGQVIPVDISSTAIQIEGSLIVQGIIRDIRERKKTEKELKRLSERLTLALNAGEVGCWEWNVQNGQVIWDDRCYELCGISWAAGDRSITCDRWLALLHPDDREPVQTLIHKALAGEKNYRNACGTVDPYQLEYRIIHTTGNVCYHRSYGTVIRNGQQQVQRLIGIVFDVSQQKHVELALKRSESNFRRLAASIPAVIYRYLHKTTGDGVFTYINPYVQTIYELEPETVMVQASLLFDHIHPEDAAPFWNALETASRSLQPLNSEHRIQTPTGVLKWVKVSAAPTQLADGDTLWQGVIWDVSERCKAQEKLKEQNRSLAYVNQQLERSTRLKDEFLANMSHELRTPLNAILGLTEGLQEEVFGPLQPKQIHCLATIEESAAHLLALITDILDISKIESGQVELEYTHISIHPFCQASLSFIKQAALHKEIQVHLEIPRTVPDLWADERRLRQALINLLSNAVKFTPTRGTITLKVDWIAASDPQSSPWLQLSVRDTGIGITAENIPRLFQPFVQVDTALNRQYAGTGLGLALVKQIAELHGGQVSLTSQLGLGSCFTLAIPYRPEQPAPPVQGLNYAVDGEPVVTAGAIGTKASPAAGGGHPGSALEADRGEADRGPIAPSLDRPALFPRSEPSPAAPMAPSLPPIESSPPSSAPSPPGSAYPHSAWSPRASSAWSERTLSLLLAEDNEANIITLKNYLEAKGYRLQVVRNGQEALAAIEQTSFDLILLDIQMPGLDGLSVMRTIRTGSALPDVPIIALTALAMKGDRERCLAAGANNYIQKPIRMNQLNSLIRETLGLSHSF